jgi:hypothetical protein
VVAGGVGYLALDRFGLEEYVLFPGVCSSFIRRLGRESHNWRLGNPSNGSQPTLSESRPLGSAHRRPYGLGDVTMKTIISISMLAVLCGCSSPHNAFIITNQTAVHAVSTNSYPRHTKEVFVTTESLPSSVKYELLEIIDVGKVWYGSSRNVKESLADRARTIGADAVVDVKTWHQPSGWSWAAPHGSGKAVKILGPLSFSITEMHGEWY